MQHVTECDIVHFLINKSNENSKAKHIVTHTCKVSPIMGLST